MADFDEYEYEGKRIRVPKGAEVDEDLLDSLSVEQDKIQKQEVHTAKRQEAQEISELSFPRTSRALEEGKGFASRTMARLFDLSSLPLRSAGALGRSNLLGAGPEWGYPTDASGQKIRMSYDQAMEQINQGLGPRGESSVISSMYKDPAALPLAATGIGAAGWILKGGKWLPTVAKGVGVGAAEGAASGLIHQAEDVALKGEEFSPKELAIETGVSAAAPAVISGAVGATTKFANFALGKLASQLSNVSEATLRKWGTGLGKGAKELQEIHGKQKQIGDQILDALENFDDYIPEKQIVDQALERMPPIPMKRTIDAAQSALNDIPMKNTNAAEVSKLKSVIKDIKAKGAELSATEFKKFRSQIDKIADFNSPGHKHAEDAAIKIRRSMQKELLEVADASGNPEVAPAMKVWSEKLGKRDAILEEIGGNAKTRERKVGQFLSTLFNKNKETKQKALADISEVFGEDFVKQSKLLQMSDEIIWEGGGKYAKVLPNMPTGKAGAALTPGVAQVTTGLMTGNPSLVVSGLGTMGAASPMVSSKMLSATSLADLVADKTIGDLTSKQIASQAARSATRQEKD